VDAQVTLLSERRRFHPYGLEGGQPGECGQNVLIRTGEATNSEATRCQETTLPSKGTFGLKAGDTLSIRTPGGGGFGKPSGSQPPKARLKRSSGT
jgi:N-methylhydantoinase B